MLRHKRTQRQEEKRGEGKKARLQKGKVPRIQKTQKKGGKGERERRQTHKRVRNTRGHKDKRKRWKSELRQLQSKRAQKVLRGRGDIKTKSTRGKG